MISYQIKVVRGSAEGKIIPLSPGEAVSIGRSRHSNNRIVVSELDVSARHCMVRMDDDGTVWLEVLSDKVTEVDGHPLKIGDNIQLQGGQEIRLGGTLSIFLEQPSGDDDMTTSAFPPASQVSDDDMATSAFPPASQVSDDDMATSALFRPSSGDVKSGAPAQPAAGGDANDTMTKTDFQTRYASFEEIEKVKKKYQSKRLKKTFSIGVAVLLFLGLSVLLFFWLRTDPESLVAWPAELKDPNAVSSYSMGSGVILVFPSTLDCRPSENGVEVFTAFGMKRDIPLHIQAEAWHDPEGLHIDRLVALRNCMLDLLQRYPTLSFEIDPTLITGEESAPKPGRKFVNTKVQGGAGVLLNYVPYTRKIDNDVYFGYMVFFRYQDQNTYSMFETSSISSRGIDYFLNGLLPNMFRVTIQATAFHWEGTSMYRKDTAVKTDLDDASRALQQNSSASWGDAFYYIRSALIKAYPEKDEESMEKAKGLLEQLRLAQADWYNRQKLSYFAARKNPDNGKSATQKIQEDCNMVYLNNNKIFEDSDFRYDLIKEKVWK